MTQPSVEIEVRIDAPPETVFSFFTDPEKYRMWQGSAADLDPRPGGAYRVQMVRSSVRGSYLVVEPPRRVVFTWGWEAGGELPPGIREVPAGATTVEVTLIPEGDGTIVRLRHTGFPGDDSASAHRWGWNLYLGRLAVAAAGGDPGPDPLPEVIRSMLDAAPPWKR